MSTVTRPAIVTDEHLLFLDALRETGVTNMYGAAPYLVKHLKVSRADSHTILGYWMKTFMERHQSYV